MIVLAWICVAVPLVVGVVLIVREMTDDWRDWETFCLAMKALALIAAFIFGAVFLIQHYDNKLHPAAPARPQLESLQ